MRRRRKRTPIWPLPPVTNEPRPIPVITEAQRKAKRFHYYFPDFESFVNDCETVAHNKSYRPEYRDNPAGERPNHSEGWHGTDSLAQSIELARHGWPKGRAKLVAAIAAAATQLAKLPSYQMDVAGAYPDVPLAVAGDPACMVDLMPIEDRKRPIVRIACNISASAAYEAEQLSNYGAAVLSYCDALESNGFRVEIEALIHGGLNDQSGMRYNLHVIAKQAEEPMELDKLAFIFVNPSFLRRLDFVHIQSRHDLPADSVKFCGTAANPVPGIDIEDNQLLVPGINTFAPDAYELSTPQAAAHALSPILERMLSEFGIAAPKLAFAEEGLA